MRSILSVSAAALLATCLSVGVHAAPAANSGGKLILASGYGSDAKGAMAKDTKKAKTSKKSSKKAKGSAKMAPVKSNTTGMGGDNPGNNNMSPQDKQPLTGPGSRDKSGSGGGDNSSSSGGSSGGSSSGSTGR